MRAPNVGNIGIGPNPYLIKRGLAPLLISYYLYDGHRHGPGNGPGPGHEHGPGPGHGHGQTTNVLKKCGLLWGYNRSINRLQTPPIWRAGF